MIEDQRAATARSINVHPAFYYLTWGVAWLVGFGLLFLRFGPHGRVYVSMPAWLPLAVLFTMLGAAAVVTWAASGRAYRQVVGRSATQGTIYGITWAITFTMMGGILGPIGERLPDDLAGMLWGCVSVALTAVLLMAGAAVFQQYAMFGLGAWLAAIDVVGVQLGPGWHSLVVSLAGGGGLIAVGVGVILRRRGKGRPG